MRRQFKGSAEVQMHLPSFDGTVPPAKPLLQIIACAAIPLHYFGGQHRDRKQNAFALVSAPTQ
jgi:hypothetical protein